MSGIFAHSTYCAQTSRHHSTCLEWMEYVGNGILHCAQTRLFTGSESRSHIRFCEMDGLSDVASVIAVLQLTVAVIGYLNDVKNATKECQQCTIEASNLQSLLINLLYRLEQGQAGDPWFVAIRALNIENGPFDQYKQALEQLLSMMEIQDGVQKFKRRLLWKFRKEEVASILERMERLKSLVSFALEDDHL